MTSTPLRFRWRAFTSLVIAACFLALILSGAVLFLAPPGRVANWTQWEILGLTKHGWGDLHIAFGALFVVAGLIHVAFNWRPLLQHLGARWAARGGFRLEGIAAALLALAVFAGTRWEVPPIATLLAWSEALRQGWEDNRARAPIPHAELLTLGELAEEAGVTTEEALARLAAAGVRAPTAETQVQALADEADLTPARVFDVIRGRTHPGETEPGASERRAGRGGFGRGAGAAGEGGSGGGGGGGGGVGWKTLRQYCDEQGLDLAAACERLEQRGIRASPEHTLREIATNHGMDRPYVLLDILREK